MRTSKTHRHRPFFVIIFDFSRDCHPRTRHFSTRHDPSRQEMIFEVKNKTLCAYNKTPRLAQHSAEAGT